MKTCNWVYPPSFLLSEYYRRIPWVQITCTWKGKGGGGAGGGGEMGRDRGGRGGQGGKEQGEEGGGPDAVTLFCTINIEMWTQGGGAN